MRPVRLELEGFGAFRDRTEVNFADADLFAVVGATGHGKSTLIDAICFALYGKVPRYGERDIAPVITLGANESKVSLTFDLGTDRYVATRVLRRSAKGGGASTRAVRLELVGDDGNDVLAGSVGEFQPAIERLLGLSFEQFTKCVVLPQGRFAEFLHARSGDRVAILTALLDLGRYDRMAAEARRRAAAAGARRGVFESERERLGAITDATVTALAEQCRALEDLRTDVDAALPLDDQLRTAIATARAERDHARATATALTAVAMPDDVRALASALGEATAAVDATAQAAAAAEHDAETRDAQVAALPALEMLAAAVEGHGELATLRERIANGDAVEHERAQRVEAARDALITAVAAVGDAQAAFDDAQHRHAHAELRAELVVGEPCPVCEHPVGQLPPKMSTAALTEARKALDAARKAQSKAESAAQAAHGELQQASALLTTLRDRHDELAEKLAGAPDSDAAAARLEAARATHAAAVAARAAATQARAAARRAREALQAMDAAIRRAEEEFRVQREQLVRAALEPPAADSGTIAQRWEALAEWAAETHPVYEKRAGELDDVVASRNAERDALFGELLARAPGVSAESVAELAAAVAAAARDAEHARRDAEQKVARASELDEQIANERATEQVAAELGRLLDKGHFGQWLVDEALRGLIAGASEILERLSGGQYALATASDGDLLVVDHVNADETRPVRSLSGGETFQASLALALALAARIAELVTDGAAALESIFLDEGFGTLDPETLDVVAGTIEALAHGARVVGIVTHVPELAERMPTRLRVRKVGRSAVVTREDA